MKVLVESTRNQSKIFRAVNKEYQDAVKAMDLVRSTEKIKPVRVRKTRSKKRSIMYRKSSNSNSRTPDRSLSNSKTRKFFVSKHSLSTN